MKHKTVSYRGDFYSQQWNNDCHNVFYITSKEEFLNTIWNLVKHLELEPISMGSWNQEGAKEKFFNGGYSSYLMSGSVKEFEEKDWYIFEYNKEYSDYDVIFVIRLNTIKEDYSSFMSQFVLNTNNYEHLLLQKGFSLNEYPEGKFWELQVTKDESLKKRICKIFGADIEMFVNGMDIDTLILQCAEDFTKCLFYYDCNPFDMTTEEFMECVNEM